MLSFLVFLIEWYNYSGHKKVNTPLLKCQVFTCSLMRFRSLLWLGHSKAWILILWSHCFVDFEVCFGSLLCWRIHFLFIFTLTWPPFSWRKTAQSMMLIRPRFTVCMMLFDDVQHCFCTKDTFWSYVQKAQPWFHQNITHFPTCVWEISNLLLQNEARLGCS